MAWERLRRARPGWRWWGRRSRREQAHWGVAVVTLLVTIGFSVYLQNRGLLGMLLFLRYEVVLAFLSFGAAAVLIRAVGQRAVIVGAGVERMRVAHRFVRVGHKGSRGLRQGC